MHDQNSIDQSETPSQKYQRALDLFTESVLKPDHKSSRLCPQSGLL